MARIALGVLSLAGLQLLLTMQLRILYEPVAESVIHGAEKLNPMLFKSMSFGQIGAAIDWEFLGCLQDPTTEHVVKGEHLEIYYNLDLVTDLDPLFFQTYVFGANLLAVVHDDGIGALQILEKGEKFRTTELPSYPEKFRHQQWGTQWQIPLLLAYTELFEMDDLPKAAIAYENAANLSGAPPYLKSLVARFHAKDGQYDVGLRLLDFLIATQKDVRAKEKLVNKKYSLQVIKYVFDLNRKFSEYVGGQKLKSAKKGTPSSTDLEVRKALWRKFLVASGTSDLDPWDGFISLNDAGAVVTATPHGKVFGLE